VCARGGESGQRQALQLQRGQEEERTGGLFGFFNLLVSTKTIERKHENSKIENAINNTESSNKATLIK
jgi:hypothetical protein